MRYKKNFNILVFNCGSSSLKYKIIGMPGETTLIKGEAERVGSRTREPSRISHHSFGKKKTIRAVLPDHKTALSKTLELIKTDAKLDSGLRFDVFAHRYVHPGNFFSAPTKVNKRVLAKLKKTLPLAPLHNPISYDLIKYCAQAYPGLDQFIVFDTAFHMTMPLEYRTYALPYRIIKRYGLKRIGFHGISHRYVMEDACRFLGRNRSSQKIISLHLGTGGSSVTAIKGGRSINNSMGFTPLEGLMMNTRCGDIDQGAVLYMMFRNRFSPGETEKILNKKSGVLGIFDVSSDLRDAIRDMGKDKKAKSAFRMYVRRARKYIGFYALILKKADVLIFTDSLGTGSSLLRERICENMEIFGVRIDKKKNDGYRRGIMDISDNGSGTRVLVVPTDEEKMIAREAYKEYIKDDTCRRQ